MSIDQSSSQDSMDKWQFMQEIVNQNHTILSSALSWQFKKIVISRLVAENILTFLLQFIGITLMGTHTSSTMTPIWFSSGTACAFVFMRGFSVLPGIFLGSFCAFYFAIGILFQSTISAGINTVQAFLLLWLSYRFISPTLIFSKIEEFVKFIFCCGILTAITSFMIGSFYYATLHDSSFMFQLWLRGWLGNLSGILVFSLAILTWDFYVLQWDDFKKINKWLVTFYYGLLLISIIFLLVSQTPFLTILFSLGSVLIIVAISVQLGWCGVIAAMFLFGLLLNFAIDLNPPLFSSHFSLATLIYLQFLLVTETIVGLVIAILIQQNPQQCVFMQDTVGKI